MRKLNLRKEDGSLNWKSILIGTSYKKFLITTVWFIAVLLMAYGYNHDIEQYKEVYENPCNYCAEMNMDSNITRYMRLIPDVNFTKYNYTIENETKERGNSNTS